MPIPGFFNLALEIDRYQRDKDPKRLLEALNSIAQNPQNGDPFTTDDVTSLLTQKIIVILPRTTPLRVAERVAEYGLMKKAAETSL
jgi:hypothetical protein